jgi:hypothetical protein
MITTILLLMSLLCFLLAAFSVLAQWPKVNLLGLGLAFYMLLLLFQSIGTVK